MRSIYVGSESEYSGKSLVCLCLGKELQNRGVKVGYFKPYGTLPCMECNQIVDEDVVYMKAHIGLGNSLEDLCPVVYSHDMKLKIYRGETEGYRDRILDSYKKVSADKEVMLIGGGRSMYEGLSFGYSAMELIEDTGSEVIMIEKYDESRGLDSLIDIKERLGDSLLGLIINRIEPENMEYIRKNVTPFIERFGINMLGAMPNDIVLAAISVRDLANGIGGRVYTAEDKLDELVYHFKVGAMTLEAASARFRKVSNKAVITGGDRVDLQVAALETPTKCLVLTGGMTPHPLIMSKADELQVPIIVVPYDTLTTVEKIHAIAGKPRIRETAKIDRALKLFRDGVDIEKLGF